MPDQAQILRIVVASPGDVQAERDAVQVVADELNRGVAKDRGLRIEVSRWETDAFPGFHDDGAQGLIDPILKIEDCDIVVGIFWTRFGKPVKDAKSGTEHELRRAYEAWKKNKRPQVMVYFSQQPHTPKTSAEARQWSKVLKFKEEFPPEGLWWNYSGAADFERLLRNHLTNFLRATLTIPPQTLTINALHQLPAPPGDFTGREGEIKELLGAVKEKGVTISGLHGMGGIGKTALALKLGEQLSEQYPDAQIFLDLRGVSEKPMSAAEALTGVLHAFFPEAKLPEGEAELASLCRSTLHGKHALLLMDNARDAAQVAPLLPPAGSALIVTSRFYLDLPGLRVKDLGTLPPADARNLLITIACGPDALASDVASNVEPVPPGRDRHFVRCAAVLAQADEIAKLCGYLPLALRSAASTLAKRVDVTPQAYAERLAAGRERLKPVEASLSSSHDLLGDALQKLFRTLSVFPGTFDAPAATAVWELSPDPAQTALGDLLAYSLLDWDAGVERYRLHDLVRQFALHKLTEEERDGAARHHAQHYAEVLRTANAKYMQGGDAIKPGLALYDLELGNIKAGQAWAAEHATTDKEAARLCSDYPNAGAYCLSLRQHPRERIEWVKAALAAARRLQDRRAEGAHLGNLGLAYTDLGETRRAIEYHEQQLTIAREMDDRRGEGAGLVNLGTAYYVLGETRRAIEHYEKALAIDREIGDRRGEGNALAGLGVANDALGEPRHAIDYYEQQLTITREIGDRPGEGQALANLGNAYADLGEPRRAIEYYERRLDIAREIGDRRGEGTALWNMSLALDKLGGRHQAIAQAKAALEIFEQIEDPNAERVRKQREEWGKAH